uniref:Homeobox protein 13-like n=1 Tax=Dermatophagoides pteronyssinus TaxID=6956 RepID=A0A6P6Y4F1_DERPT|nr:homeobox protein 13-like [Dermatophagoides pteronyssinus]
MNTQQQSNSNNNINRNDNDNANVSVEFQVTHDPLDHAESTSQFDLRIGDEIEINDDFNWLSNHTNNRNAEWRSSPLPPVRINFERARSVPNVHEYSGNVSYNDARSQSDSNIYSYQRSQSFQDCGMFVNVSIPDMMQQFGDYSNSDVYERPVSVPPAPIHSDSLEHDD